MFGRNVFACACVLPLLSLACGRQGTDPPSKGSTEAVTRGCCVPLSDVRYHAPAEHDLAFTNAVMVYPVEKTGRLRVNAIFADDVHQEFRVREGDYYSDDRGKTWRFETSALPDSAPTSLGRHPADPRFVYRIVSETERALASKWIERSEDGGRSWRRTKATVEGFNSSLRHFMLPRDYYHPRHPQVLFVYSSELAGFYGKSEVVFRSEDGGDSFRIWYIVAKAPQEPLIAISPVDPKVVYVSGDYGSVLKSVDAGETFRLVGMNDELRMPVVLERDKVSGRINRTGWNHGRQLLAHPYERDSVFAVTERGVLRSRDGGDTWCALGLDVESGGTMVNIQVDVNDRSTLYVGSYFGLHVSRDDGCSWERIEIFRRVVQ